MGRKCEASFCSNNDSKNQGRSFFKFPNDYERCQLWVKYCQSPALDDEFRVGGPPALEKKRLCCDHFTYDAMRDPCRFDKGLRMLAIPSIEFMSVEYRDGSFSQMMTNQEHADESPAFIDEDVDMNDNLEDDVLDYEYMECSMDRLIHLQIEPVPGKSEQSTHQNNDFIHPGYDTESDVGNLYEDLQNTSISHSKVFDKTEIHQQENIIDDGNCVPEADPQKDLKAYLETAQQLTPEASPEQVLMIAQQAKKIIDAHDREDSNKNKQLVGTVKSLKNRLRNSERTSKRRAFSMRYKKLKNKSQNQNFKRVRNLNKHDSKILEHINTNPVLYDSIRNSMRPKKARRYNKQMQKFAVSLYLSGPRTYRMIQRSKVLCLPEKRTIKRWTNKVRYEPGLNNVILQKIGEKCRDFSDRDKIVVLAIDGMKIKSTLNYSAKSDVFHGFPDNEIEKQNERNKCSILATEAVAVMIRGVYKPFKQGLGYFLTHNLLGSSEQLKLVKNTIRAIKNAGLNPLVLTMDQHATNVKMAKEAGATTEKPYFLVDGNPVYIMRDPPPLTKSARNMIKKHNAVFNRNVASFNDIEKLYEIDSLSNPRLVPKLTEKHVRVPPFSPMNVSLATRTLSQSVGTGIRYYVGTGELPKRALQTAQFVEMHDKLFDAFNSKREICTAKPLKSALSQNSQHWEFLEEVQRILEKMFFTKKSCFEISKAKGESKDLTIIQRRPNYIRGFLNNINAVKLLWKHLQANFIADDLCTNHLCQDFLENLFSEIRRRCGSNDAPDALQFGTAFKYAAIESSMQACNGENCEPDSTLPLICNKDVNESIMTGPAQNVTTTSVLTPLNTSKPLEITLRELNGLTYIIGAAVRKLPHKKCTENLVEDRQEVKFDYAYDFVKLKQLSTATHLHLPNKKLNDIGVLCFAAFNQKFSKFLSRSKVGVKTKLKRYINYELFDDGICKKCFSLLIDKIFNTFIQGYLKTTKAKLAAKERVKRFKRNRKAGKMCLPL